MLPFLKALNPLGPTTKLKDQLLSELAVSSRHKCYVEYGALYPQPCLRLPIQVKVERMRSHANEKLMNKLASARRRSEELRAAAEARRSEEAAKAARKAEIIKKTGKIPGVLFLNLLCT